uniref:Uncharacterized protein n=1 Tax=Aegilops tauschii subsp. strangulata TaxID=200361 RepID=A0A453JAT9_AEGTS
ASATGSKKTMLRVLIFPFFATSHIEPFTDLAVRLVAAGPAVEATVAVTPANVPVVQSLLRRRGQPEHVKIATYPFPAVDGLPEGVENLGRATEADSWRIDAAALSENLTRPAQEALARGLSPDAVVTDVHFAWNVRVAGELGVPCVAFSAISAFPTLALHHLAAAARSRAGGRREALPVGGEGRGELDPAGGVVRACGRPRAPRHGVGPADGHTGAPGRRRVRDALRVELRPGDGDGGGAGADVAHGVRAVHHREVGDGGAGDRGAAVA